MSYVWATLYLALLFAVLGLHIVSLPANWVLLGLVALWGWLAPDAHFGWQFYALLVALALVGEVIEFVAQYYGAKKYGATGKGNLGGMLGAIAGALAGAPFFLGLGALAGAIAGAFFGCYFFERHQGRDKAEARHAAFGTMYGKVLGMAAKIGLGGAMWVAAVRKIWP
ncbi:hypothetical protein ASZ90_001398 [hydrocarbon metagenome]|uniref:DUF456 domain-containing protein n=1 Tax=hydrocarbon metagenome TaxID=938273 RepID=A0A0W8G6I0_9ZZZZ